MIVICENTKLFSSHADLLCLIGLPHWNSEFAIPHVRNELAKLFPLNSDQTSNNFKFLPLCVQLPNSILHPGNLIRARKRSHQSTIDPTIHRNQFHFHSPSKKALTPLEFTADFALFLHYLLSLKPKHLTIIPPIPIRHSLKFNLCSNCLSFNEPSHCNSFLQFLIWQLSFLENSSTQISVLYWQDIFFAVETTFDIFPLNFDPKSYNLEGTSLSPQAKVKLSEIIHHLALDFHKSDSIHSSVHY